MAMTLRLPEELAQRGRRYAAELGISLNGLVAIARQVKAGPVRRRR